MSSSHKKLFCCISKKFSYPISDNFFDYQSPFFAISFKSLIIKLKGKNSSQFSLKLKVLKVKNPIQKAHQSPDMYAKTHGLKTWLRHITKEETNV